MKIIQGIYSITCNVENRSYYGSSVDINKRLYYHKHGLVKGKHHNKLLQNAWDEFGEENFSFTIIEVVNHKCDLAATAVARGVRKSHKGWTAKFANYLENNENKTYV